MGHWYDKHCNPCHTVIGSNGKERDTTLRDARKNNWIPSVTTITSILASPGLDTYKENQVIEACLHYEYKQGMSIEEWKTDIRKMARDHASRAATRGNEIHNSIEHWFNTGCYDDNRDYVQPVISFVTSNIIKKGTPISEQTFVHNLGFAGKCDLYCPVDRYILDFKTKDKEDLSKVTCYESQEMQTAAYALGLFDKGYSSDSYYEDCKDIKRYDLFISTHTPGVLKIVEHTDFKRDWDMFYSLLSYWQTKTGYKPDYE